jgi:hypothetical protein
LGDDVIEIVAVIAGLFLLGMFMRVLPVIISKLIFDRVPKTFPQLLLGIFVVCMLMLFFIMHRTP